MKGIANDRDRVRFFVRTANEVLERVVRYIEPQRVAHETLLEAVYFDDPRLSVPYDASVRTTRRLNDWERPAAPEHDYILDIRTGTALGRSRAGVPCSIVDAPSVISRLLGIRSVSPHFAVQFRRRQYATPGGGTRLTIDSDVRYFSLVDGGCTMIGEETTPRVKVVRTRREIRAEDVALDAALASMQRLPLISKKWMGYFFMKRAHKRALDNELAGFEYETKLDAEHLDVDLGALPFPLLEIFQSETVRRYYDDFHVSFRAGRATIVRKSAAENIAGVLKRREVKEKERSTWDLPIPRAQMRRIKRLVNMVRPDTGRVYTMALECCRLNGDTRYQIEIEYDGTFDLQHRTPDTSRPIVEAEIVQDILLVRDALVARHGFRPSLETKRGWLGVTKRSDARAEV